MTTRTNTDFDRAQIAADLARWNDRRTVDQFIADIMRMTRLAGRA